MNRRIVLSLGAGVQSSALALMASAGEFGEMPEIAVFADTRAEPRAIYEHLEYLRAALQFPVAVVSAGDLGANSLLVARDGKDDSPRLHCMIPAFVSDGKRAKSLRAECVVKYKLLPIRRFLNSWRGRQPVELWLGVPAEQSSRMCDSGVGWLKHRYPLVERGFTRSDCIKWMAANGHPVVEQSGCYFCPYRSPHRWLFMHREECLKAVFYEPLLQRAYERAGIASRGKGPWLHPKCMPFVDLFDELEGLRGHLDMFDCERLGLCGV